MLNRLLGIVLAVLLALGAGIVWYQFSLFGPRIQATIETQGSLATQTQVTVGDVELSPFSGSGAIDGLTVGNPAGFSSPYAVAVNRIALQLEVPTLLGSGPVIVDSATIIMPRITFEASSPDGVSNLETIKNNAQAFATSPAAQMMAPGRKAIIRDLTVIGGAITLDIPLPGIDQLSVPLPPLHLINVGADTDGATPPEIIRIVCEAIASEAKWAVTEALAEKLKSALSALKPGGFAPPFPLFQHFPPPPPPPVIQPIMPPPGF